MATLKLKRTLLQSPNGRVSSICEINDRQVTLKSLRYISAPLLAIVDAAAAAAALSRPASRLAILDAGISSDVLSRTRKSQREYRQSRNHREKLEQELASRVLPGGIAQGADGQDLDLLQHWIEELNIFQSRMHHFCESIGPVPLTSSPLVQAISALASTSWLDNINEGGDFSSAMYARLVEFRDAVKSVESQMEAARTACECLSFLSSPQSAVTALERARDHLFDAAANETPGSPISVAAERSHEKLNVVEEALRDCVKSLEDDRAGLLATLEEERGEVQLSLEEIEEVISGWNLLSRKHGISPYTLPACHAALQDELHGNVEARLMLPKAIAREEEALKIFEEDCQELSTARQEIARSLSESVTKRMPSLGMGGSKFDARLFGGARECTDPSVYTGTAGVGIDTVDFLLFHGGLDTDTSSPAHRKRPRGGSLATVGSAGEKARVLLAIECDLPGSIGASCRTCSLDDSSSSAAGISMPPPPVAVVYDEIDAHVGGRAAVAMAEMLADQSRARGLGNSSGQIISITHSPSVAAIADTHLVIKKATKPGMGSQDCVPVTATLVDGTLRRKELARMASGDVAPEEAERFAGALLRDGEIKRGASAVTEV